MMEEAGNTISVGFRVDGKLILVDRMFDYVYSFSLRHIY